MQPAIRTTSLARSFAGRIAVDDVALAVPKRSIYGFLGRNGAGKTTTIRMLLGLLRPDGGSIELLGRTLDRSSRADIMAQVGALVETPQHYDHLTARENLAVTCHLRRLPLTEADRTLEALDLAGASRRRVGGFSLGMRQRLGLARALLGRPKLLILDEPTNGLDPGGIIAMRALLRRLVDQEGATVFLSSHLLGEVELIADYVGLIEGGELVAQGAVTDLLGGHGRTIEVVVDAVDDALRVLDAAGIAAERTGPSDLALRPARDSGEMPDVARLLVDAGCRLSHLVERRPTLEDLYRLHIERTGPREELQSC